MYRRLIIIAIILFCSLAVFCGLGLRAIDMHAQGLAARRNGEFIEVAQQIRLDVKRKLDDFLQAEQKRPYTDYQYFFIPDNVLRNEAMLVSPLADKLDNGFAYGYFEVDASGIVNTPYLPPGQATSSRPLVQNYLDAVRKNLLPSLDGRTQLDAPRIFPASGEVFIAGGFESDDKLTSRRDQAGMLREESSSLKSVPVSDEEEAANEPVSKKTSVGKGVPLDRSQRYRIQTFEQEDQTPQIITQSRAQVELNRANTQQQIQQPEGNMDIPGGARGPQAVQTSNTVQMGSQTDQVRWGAAPPRPSGQSVMGMQQAETPAEAGSKQKDAVDINGPQTPILNYDMQQAGPADTVQIRIEPFTPVIVPAADSKDAPVFGGDIYLLRHIQIEQNHFLQGFRLNQAELLAEIRESATRLVRYGMRFDIARNEELSAVHSAILDFGFGDLVLNLFETNPGRLAGQISRLRTFYFAVTAVVILAVSLALLSLGRNLHAQLKLARKKDDFISAVSHELRTPLTSIRMYTEMLEKDWVKSEEKRTEYYGSMRQETERLSRLIENVLDFSRLQRKNKKFTFTLGSLNTCIEEAVRMFAPCALRAGFEIKTELTPLDPLAFDKDAVTQIVINLLDNAVKYAKGAADNTVTIRTIRQKDYVLLEVEDHGPGIPRKLHGKVFEEFYRCADEATRETTGTGLGLALVKRFAEAHHGFVSILAAKPSGVILRIGLPLTASSRI